jgi:drug/metabolite transporter (DMT)-like permease
MSGNPVPESSHLRALVWIAPCVVAWSFIPRLASNPANLDPHQYLFWSSVVSAACLLACTGLLGRWQALRAYSGTDLRRIIALASLGAFGYCALLYSAYSPCTGGECPGKTHLVIIVHYTWPALSVLWSTVLLRDRLTGPMILSLLLGVLAVAIGASTTASPGDALSRLPAVLLAAVIFGLYSTLLKRVDYEPFSSHAVTFGTAAVLSCVAMSVMSERWTFPNPDAVVAVLVNGALVNALSYVCWYRALRAAPITFVAPWVVLTPVLAAIVASQSTWPSDEHWVGIGLVLLSVLLATVRPSTSTDSSLTDSSFGDSAPRDSSPRDWPSHRSRPYESSRYELAEESR